MSSCLFPARASRVCLVLAPTAELVEQVLSPLKGTSTAADLAAIEAHRGAFTVSVLIGLLATVAYVPAFTGLALTCLPHSRAAARVGGSLAVVSMLGFSGVRMLQAVVLQAVDDGMDHHLAAQLIDHTSTGPIGAVLLVMFLGGTAVGVLALAVASWRAKLPRPAVVLLVLFPFIDLAAPGHLGSVVSHTVLLVALGWLAYAAAMPQREQGDLTVTGSLRRPVREPES